MKNKLKVLLNAICCVAAINNNGYSMSPNQNFFINYKPIYSLSIQYKPLLNNLKQVEQSNKLNTTGKHKGIANAGNTCYISAALQCFACQSSFIRQFFRHISKDFKQIDKMPCTNENMLTLEFAEIMANVWGDNNIDNGHNAYNFAFLLQNVNNKYQQFEPSDTAAVLVQILDSLHNVLSDNKCNI